MWQHVRLRRIPELADFDDLLNGEQFRFRCAQQAHIQATGALNFHVTVAIGPLRVNQQNINIQPVSDAKKFPVKAETVCFQKLPTLIKSEPTGN